MRGDLTFAVMFDLLKEDPHTHRMICQDCWNGNHRRRVPKPNKYAAFPKPQLPMCRSDECKCLCKERVIKKRERKK